MSAKKPRQLAKLNFDKYLPEFIDDEPPQTITASIQDEVTREHKIKNDDAEQDIALKRKTLERLFRFLAAETVVVFTFALLQGTGWLNFQLQEWSFNLLLSATILQITAMLYVAVRYLFPKSRD